MSERAAGNERSGCGHHTWLARMYPGWWYPFWARPFAPELLGCLSCATVAASWGHAGIPWDGQLGGVRGVLWRQPCLLLWPGPSGLVPMAPDKANNSLGSPRLADSLPSLRPTVACGTAREEG